MWRPVHLLVLLLAAALTRLPSHVHAQDGNQAVHQHIPAVPDDLIPGHTTTYTPTTSPSSPPTAASAATDTTRHTVQPVLAYVTPWNRAGYDAAVNQSHKFTLLSPVWFQLKLSSHSSAQHAGRQALSVLVTGEHDVDAEWMAAVRAANPAVRIVPRFMVEMSAVHLLKLMRTPKMHRQLHKRILGIVDKYGLDGIVLEEASMHGIARRDPANVRELLGQANTLLRSLGTALHAHTPRLLFIHVVRPPFPRSPYFGAADYADVSSEVDYTSLMTYDFSAAQEAPGPNAPIDWARRSMHALLGDRATAADRAKVLLGVNMYGMRWRTGEGGKGAGEPILARDYEAAVREAEAAGAKVRRSWDEEAAEERTELESGVVMFYPTPASVRLRVSLANNEGCGLSLWEIGQGTPELYDTI